MKLQPVILAGGSGYRLWPLSDQVKPKQFIKYFDDLSSFQNTVIRNKHLGTPLIIANISHKEIINLQLKELGAEAEIIFEPEQKNTAAPAVIAAIYAKRKGFNAIALLPSDHYIINQAKYRTTIKQAIDAVTKYKFITIGIKPHCFNHNFGYLKTDHEIATNLHSVIKFIEKPKEEFDDIHSYFWNSGIYLFDIEYFLELANKLISLTTKTLSGILYAEDSNKDGICIDPELYKELPSISFDNGISVPLEKMMMVKANFRWNDLGNWEAICNMEKQDNDQNNIIGKVITHNVKNSYINSDAKQTVAIDLEDTIVVFKNGQLFISHKEGVGRIKDILEELEKVG